jgi:uncharacterized protein
MEKPKVELMTAEVGHARLWPKKNSFLYRVFYIKLPVLDSGDLQTPALFSFNKWNIFSLKTSSYGHKSKAAKLYDFILAKLASAGANPGPGYRYYLITHPRLFGYAFNPISYWLAVDDEGSLRAVLCSVNNTFRQSHDYVLFKSDNSPIGINDTLTADKILYVSPFNKVEGHYRFKFDYTGSRFKSVIDYYDADDRHVLYTCMKGVYGRLSSFAVVKTVLVYPFMTIAVVARIRLQAIKLMLKRVKLTTRTRPK